MAKGILQNLKELINISSIEDDLHMNRLDNHLCGTCRIFSKNAEKAHARIGLRVWIGFMFFVLVFLVVAFFKNLKGVF